VAAGEAVVVVVPTTTVAAVVVTWFVTVWVAVTVTGDAGAVTVTGSVGVVSVTVSCGRVTVTVVVRIGWAGAASVVVGTKSVVIAAVVVRDGTESVGVDLVGVVRVPSAAWFPPPHEVRTTAVATPMAAAVT
jgi:hypothetical protein